MTDDQLRFDAVLGTWYRRARESQFSHYAAATRLSSSGRLLGSASAVLSAVTGTALFGTLSSGSGSSVLQVVLGLISIAAATLSATTTFLGFEERANKHREIATLYGSLRRSIERLQAFPPATESLDKNLDELRIRLDSAADMAPAVSSRIWRRATRDLQNTARPNGFDLEYWDNFHPNDSPIRQN